MTQSKAGQRAELVERYGDAPAVLDTINALIETDAEIRGTRRGTPDSKNTRARLRLKLIERRDKLIRTLEEIGTPDTFPMPDLTDPVARAKSEVLLNVNPVAVPAAMTLLRKHEPRWLDVTLPAFRTTHGDDEDTHKWRFMLLIALYRTSDELPAMVERFTASVEDADGHTPEWLDLFIDETKTGCVR